jgi:hypothetical protein
MRLYGNTAMPGAPGNNLYGSMIAGVDLPFGGGNQYRNLQQQYQPGVDPRQYDRIRIYPQTEPGRKGAITIPSQRVSLPGAAGNLGGMAQLPPGYVKSVY